MSLIFKLAYCRAVPSANKSQIAFFTESGRSFIYKVNNNGPRMELCRTPVLVSHFEEMPFELTDWVQLYKCDL